MDTFELPALLAGPIVRRVETHQIVIWMATSKHYAVHPELFTIDTDSKPFIYEPVPIQNEQNTVKLGKSLFVHLLKIIPANGLFPADQLLGYNFTFSNNGECFDLHDLGLLTAENSWSIVYGDLKYPSLFIKGSDQNSHFLYGSCRKVHGEGDDTLILGDALVEKNHIDIVNRPNSLFLTGDQIYADDVPDPLIRIISKFSELLIGRRESLHELDHRLSHEPFKESINQINGRQFIMENFCQFTSGSAHNHLIEFGEYAAMYLLSWSPVLWELAQEYDLFESFHDAFDNNHIYFRFPNTDYYQKEHLQEKKLLKNRYFAEQELITSFQHSLYRGARLLANIPVYMIFDDHDVTDDWNISDGWRRAVRQSALGRHVVSNALASYWAFQGWGNNPDAFDECFVSIMKDYMDGLINGDMKKHHDKWVQLLWSFNHWKFVAPTFPKALFLDTRTQRKFDLKPKPVKIGSIIEETNPPPQLINKIEWQQNIKHLLFSSGWKKNSPLVIVSATPVYGMGLIESFLHNYVYPLKVLGVNVNTKFDFEAWKYNGKGFSTFLNHVSKWEPSPCIILSGDVHYGSAVHAEIEFNDGRKMAIKQYTASPIKNMSFTKLWGLLMKIAVKANTINRTNKDIYRYCDHSYCIHRLDERQQPDKDKYVWMDKLRYQPVSHHSIIEIQNHLGHLTYSDQSCKNELLK
ncbi:hypothetical protein [Bacillus sp. S/N-304-OC-R1]|uniref:hypothetical protein n=1 Tax=Bacillus sp. S/N-304-OC-R1 TaxID=2758034 RepID=UPI001C8D28AA|nr:hypothetical protein [Bacillus sp. S/N-304-OC-R1]MBY0123539.1 hypothetical protein [Bacillus sp. S/N-304-OC-R1]